MRIIGEENIDSGFSTQGRREAGAEPTSRKRSEIQDEKVQAEKIFSTSFRRSIHSTYMLLVNALSPAASFDQLPMELLHQSCHQRSCSDLEPISSGSCCNHCQQFQLHRNAARITETPYQQCCLLLLALSTFLIRLKRPMAQIGSLNLSTQKTSPLILLETLLPSLPSSHPFIARSDGQPRSAPRLICYFTPNKITTEWKEPFSSQHLLFHTASLTHSFRSSSQPDQLSSVFMKVNLSSRRQQLMPLSSNLLVGELSYS